METLLEQAIEAIELTTDKFYKSKTEEGYKTLENALNIFMKIADEVHIYIQAGREVGIEVSQLVLTLTEAMKALEQKDTVLLADILEYELKELFLHIQKEIG